MKKRILVIATSVLLVGGVIGGASIVAATNGGEVVERVAKDIGVSATELTSAIETAQATAKTAQNATKAARLDAQITALVGRGTITSEQGTQLKTWINSKPDIEGSLRGEKGSKKLDGLWHSDAVAKTLGTTAEALEQAYETAIKELRAEYAAMTPVNRRLAKIDGALADDSITAVEANSLRTWVNAMPDWLNNNTTFGKVLGYYLGGYNNFSEHDFGGPGFGEHDFGMPGFGMHNGFGEHDFGMPGFGMHNGFSEYGFGRY